MDPITEIAPDVFRLSIFVEPFDLQFNHFLVRDDEPMLFHTGMRQMFPQMRELVARVIEPAKLRWISWSHFEVDECGAVNEWLQAAPKAQAVCSALGALVNLADFAIRPARGLNKDDVLCTGKYRFRYHATPHLPHGWDAGVLFEETKRTLFCSDLFHQVGDVAAVTDSPSLLDRSRQALIAYQAGPLMEYVPYTHRTGLMLRELAALSPTTLATMHGSSFTGDGAVMLRRLDPILAEVFGPRKD